MKIITSILVFIAIHVFVDAQVTLSTDFTNDSNKKAVLHDIWSVGNRISPKDGAALRQDLSVNTVRMIGGIKKTVKGVKVPYLEYDPCIYDSTTNTYVYNWAVLKSRIDAIRTSGIKIYQIVVDQPPWAFQHGYTFIPEGTRDSIHFREDEKMTSYGNSLPPFDKQAYFNFIRAMMLELVATYGKTEVESWRFRVGSEIETPDHWKGTKQEFIEHFANTEKAIRSVLPNAIIGVHTREPNFIYRNGTVLNYKGEKIESFAKDLIEYCYNNNIRYDFWGISDYILINQASKREISKKYDELFAPLINHPKWNKNATLDIMEYSVVISMNAPDGTGFLNCETSHSEIINLGFSDIIYNNSDKGLDKIFRWGNRPNTPNPPSVDVLKSMVGKIRYQTVKQGEPKVLQNELNAIFAKKENSYEYDILLYSFNDSSLTYQQQEPVTIFFNVDVAVGTKFKYRNLYYGKEHNNLQVFMTNQSFSGWLKKDFDEKGEPLRTLNAEGLAAYNSFINPNKYEYSQWLEIITVARTDGGKGSMVKFETEIPSFAFKKFELKLN